MRTPYDRDGPQADVPEIPVRSAQFRHPGTRRWTPLAGDVDPARPDTWRDGSTIGWSVYLEDHGWLPLVPQTQGRKRTTSVTDWAVLSLGLLILFVVVAAVTGMAPRSSVDEVPVSDRSTSLVVTTGLSPGR